VTALSGAELDDLLRRPILGRLATVRADGWPSVVPVWIEWDGTQAWVIARAASRFVDDVRGEPRVCLSVVADDDPDRRAQLFCRVTIVGDAGPLQGETLAMARRMALRYEGDAGLGYIDESAAWPRVLLRLEPERVVSWASPDWHDRYGSGDHAETSTPTPAPADRSADPAPSSDSRSARP
jgi:PPOX class probable F420-dependent enzyme